jgi:D-aspartate ligase
VRRAAVFGLLHAGLAVTRSLGRIGVPVTGISWGPNEFGLKSRYLDRRVVVAPGDDEAVLDAIGEERVAFFPDRDEHVEFALRNWDALRARADLPLPDDADAVRRLRRKDVLPLVAAEAEVPSPRTVLAASDEAVRDANLRPPLVVKAVEGQEYALTFGHKAVVAEDVDEALLAVDEARERGFQMIVQEIVPDSHEHIYSLLAYVGRSGEPLVTLVGRKVRQGPLRFGTSAVFEVEYQPAVLELGLRLLRTAGYTGVAHVEFAQDPSNGEFMLLEVNTRLPVWAALAANRHLDLPRIVYDDLSGKEVAPLPTFREQLTWLYFAKDVWVSLQMARRRELGPREFASRYIRGRKARAVFARDDPRPAIASLGYLRSRTPLFQGAEASSRPGGGHDHGGPAGSDPGGPGGGDPADDGLAGALPPAASGLQGRAVRGLEVPDDEGGRGPS